jgi:membrane protein DedA with SNARE-associated domain
MEDGSIAMSPGELSELLTTYGYLAVGGIVALESIGIPLPGETTLIAASILAGTTHALNIWGVIGAAAAGAIIGDNIGFWIGRELGFWLLVRYGRYVGLNDSRLKIGQYLFLQHGGKVVFWGRFIALLRVFAAALAGANCMAWSRFLFFNATGGIVWAIIYGLGGYYFGRELERSATPAGIVIGVAAFCAFIAGAYLIRRYEVQLAGQAEASLPGPISRIYHRRRGTGRC